MLTRINRSATNAMRYRKVLWLHALVSALLFSAPEQAHASDLLADTYLISVFQGSNRSTLGRSLGDGGFELSTGEFFTLRDFYTPTVPHLSVLFLRQVSPTFGFLWGFGTGERAPKYEIEPSIYIGVLAQHEVFENAFVSLRAVYPIGGRLRERSCTGDFGEIGGIQEVNCRLAAGLLPPSETLQFLATASGEIDANVSLSFTWVF